MAEKPPIFVVTDRRKFTADGEIREGYIAPEPEPTPAPAPVAAQPAPPPAAEAAAPSTATTKVVTMPGRARSAEAEEAAHDTPLSYGEPGYDVDGDGIAAEAELGEPYSAEGYDDTQEGEIGPPPTAAEAAAQEAAYRQATRQVDLLMAQANPGMKAQAPVGFEHLVQSFYLSAIMAMGAGTEPGQKPRIDIVGARQSIDMLAVLEQKTRGNLNENEQRLVQGIGFELRMMFLELTSTIAKPAPQAPPPPFGRK